MTRTGRTGAYTLAATTLGSSLAFLDAMVVVVALPRIGRELDLDLAGQQWVLLAYSLALAALYLVGGALGDRRGRRRMFVLGVLGFAAASALAGAAPGEATLVVARALQGVAGALLTTNSLALLRATYGDDSGRAIGLWTSLTSAATLIGPPLGGVIVEYASWRWIFFVNLPLAAAAILLARLGDPGDEAPTGSRRIDYAGAASAACGIGLLTFGIVEVPDRGFGAVWWAFVAAAATLTAFVVSQRIVADPLLPPALFRHRPFTVVNLQTLLVYGALAGIFVYVTLYLQFLGFSPLGAGLVLLPVNVALIALGAKMGGLADRRGPRGLLVAAPLLLAGAACCFLPVAERSDFWKFGVVAVGLLAAGLATLVAPITAVAMSAAPREAAGIASGVNATLSRLGSLLAIAVLGLVAALVYQRTATQGSPLEVGQASPMLRSASVDSFRAVMAAVALLALAGALVGMVGYRQTRA